MTSELVGSLLITLQPTVSDATARSSDGSGGRVRPFVLTVTREGATAGSGLGAPLPGEDEVLQRLVEGLETNVYAPGVATRLGTAARDAQQRAAAKAGAAVAEAAAKAAKAESSVEAAVAVVAEPARPQERSGESRKGAWR